MVATIISILKCGRIDLKSSVSWIQLEVSINLVCSSFNVSSCFFNCLTCSFTKRPDQLLSSLITPFFIVPAFDITALPSVTTFTFSKTLGALKKRLHAVSKSSHSTVNSFLYIFSTRHGVYFSRQYWLLSSCLKNRFRSFKIWV